MECDRISELPDALLAHILSYLRFNLSIKTSVLSKRWKFLWLKVPGLELNSYFPPHGKALVKVMDRILEFNHGLSFQKLKVKYEKRNACSNRFREWIATLTDGGIQHLDVEHKYLHAMPRNVFKSKTLVSLKLTNFGFETQELIVSLPCLKIMDLKQMNYQKVGPLFIEKLISGCPVLEDLTLAQCNFHIYVPVLRVTSKTLKILRLTSAWSDDKTKFSVEIDAPGLKFMSLVGRQFDRTVVKNLSSSVKINLHTSRHALKAEDLRKSDTIGDFLTSISSVRHMIISSSTLQVLYRYSKMGQIPKFHNLSHVQATFSSYSLQFLPIFLENCPNLKNLFLDGFYLSRGDLTNGNVPQCLTSTLECVRIKDLSLKEEIGIKIVNYFLENSAILKELILSFSKYHPMPNNDSDIIMKLRTSTKLSSNCQVFVDNCRNGV